MARKAKSPYDVHPGVAHARAIIDNLPANTGKSLDQWLRLVEASGISGMKERRDWLKKEHKLGGTSASMIADMAQGVPEESVDPDVYLRDAVAYVEAMYTGPKAHLRPIHDVLIELGRGLGSDVKVCPCKTIVPLYRNHVFAQVKPATQKRLDFGLALKNATKKIGKRLLDTGGLAKGDRITHSFRLSTVDEIDAEVKEWLRIAYDLDAD